MCPWGSAPWELTWSRMLDSLDHLHSLYCSYLQLAVLAPIATGETMAQSSCDQLSKKTTALYVQISNLVSTVKRRLTLLLPNFNASDIA